MATQTWILHIDMDAFYASIEQKDDPRLRGKPVIVGIGPRSVVSAASYEARAFGVRSAMPVTRARQLCPHGIFVPVRRQRYAEVSRQVMKTLCGFSPCVEQASIDEAYMDATGLEHIHGPAETLPPRIQAAVFAATGLTCSIGMAPVKFLAKIASDLRKPNGITLLPPEAVNAFLESLPIEKLPGVGRRTLDALRALGVHTGGGVLRFPLEFWERRLGKAGRSLWSRAQGIDPSQVEPYAAPKSESAERTLETDTFDREILRRWLLRHAERIGENVRRMGVKGATVTLKIKFHDFQALSRSRTLAAPTDSTKLLYQTGSALLRELTLPKKVRLIGLGLSGLTREAGQLSLLALDAPADADAKRDAALNKALDEVRERFGKNAILRGGVLEIGKT